MVRPSRDASGIQRSRRHRLFRWSGWELRFGDLDAICMEEPVLYVFGLTEFDLRYVHRVRLISRFDFKRALADFRRAPVFSKNMLHKPGNVPCHSGLLTMRSLH